jgi:toxin-antitoxin system PIN domain toxin
LSASVSLFDASVWVALAFASHPHPPEAEEEFDAADSLHPAAFCRATQQAFLRLVTTPAVQKVYGSGTITNDEAWAKWEELSALPQIVWLAEPAGLEAHWQSYARWPYASPKLWMDAYLAAFARCLGMQLVTLDQDFKKFPDLRLRLLLAPNTPRP